MPTPTHTTLPTVAPRERSLVVTVEESIFAAKPDILPAEGTLYKNFDKEIFAGDYRQQFENYKYKGQIGEHGLLFVKTKTEAERNTLIKPEYKLKESVPWLAVLAWIEFNQDRGAPLSQNTVDGAGRQGTVIIPRWLVRRGYVHGQTLMTEIRVREYLSDEPWPDALLPCDEPQGTEVSWDLVGSHGSTGRCLHKEVEVPPQGGPYAVISSDGQPQSAAATAQNASQIFPRTPNATRWQDFTTNEVKKVQEQYHRIEKTYIAPVMPKESIISG